MKFGDPPLEIFSKNVHFSLWGKQCIVLPKWTFFRILAHCEIYAIFLTYPYYKFHPLNPHAFVLIFFYKERISALRRSQSCKDDFLALIWEELLIQTSSALCHYLHHCFMCSTRSTRISGLQVCATECLSHSRHNLSFKNSALRILYILIYLSF